MHVYMYFTLAVILAGHHATGKTSSLSTVISVYNVMQRRSQLLVSTRLQRINPAVFGDLHTLYGHVNANGDWVDGIFTAAFRKANKVYLPVDMHVVSKQACISLFKIYLFDIQFSYQ